MKHILIISSLSITVLIIVISKPKEVKVYSKKEYFELKAKINHVAKLTKCDSG